MRRLSPALLLVLVLFLAAPAIGDPGDRKKQVDAELSNIRDRIDEARERERSLNTEIDSVTTRIRELEQQVGDVSARLGPLEEDLALHRERLDKLNALFALQQERLRFMRRSYRLAVHRLELRLVRIYEQGRAETLDIVLASKSFGELVDQVEFAQRIKDQDVRIAGQVKHARNEARETLGHTRTTRARVAAVTRTIQVRTDQVRALRDSLVSQEGALSSARAEKQEAASDLDENLKEMLEEADSLQQSSAELAARIQEAQSSGASAPSTPSSSSGLIWPVNGPVASPFGYRCLEGLCRMHEGIDIGVGDGTPIHAAASGTVISAGWDGGYGNLILIDHGGGLATAYAHQSSFAVTGGQVSQGQVIGYVGCTGRCFGPHLHFEVRVDGAAVDPFGYL
jgi:murein DD-endopeptidase MepM/ murein hydrolase activator NlpD